MAEKLGDKVRAIIPRDTVMGEVREVVVAALELYAEMLATALRASEKRCADTGLDDLAGLQRINADAVEGICADMVAIVREGREVH